MVGTSKAENTLTTFSQSIVQNEWPIITGHLRVTALLQPFCAPLHCSANGSPLPTSNGKGENSGPNRKIEALAAFATLCKLAAVRLQTLLEVLSMKMSLALLAFVISLLSLALQLRGQKPVPPLEKFMVPLRLSELEHRMERADVRLIRDSALTRNGIGVPFMRAITDDHQRIIVRVLVSEEGLPQAYDERKKALMETALLPLSTVASEFDLKFSSAMNVVTVQFLNTKDILREVNADKMYAEYKGGELTFH
jgi:hypothetical protein